jgi:hypothetical protein
MNLVLEYRNAIHFSDIIIMLLNMFMNMFIYAWIVLGSSTCAWTESKMPLNLALGGGGRPSVPGPFQCSDGLGPGFYKAAWSMVSPDCFGCSKNFTPALWTWR